MIVERLTCWERAVHSVICTCLSWTFVKFCVCSSCPFGIEGGTWDVIILIPDHCLSIYLVMLTSREQLITPPKLRTKCM